MKASHLRIGNLVKDIDENIFNIKQENLCDFANGFIVVNPILLTKERLLNLGFVFYADSDDRLFVYLNNHKYDCSTLIYSLKEKVLRFNNGEEKGTEIIRHIKYVHEIQNLFFGLTGREL
jgi:hypothetical protein